MKGRYVIVRKYFGTFDGFDCFCATDDLFNAVELCERLAKAYDDCLYSFDFRKTVSDVDEGLDFYPGESLLDMGFVYDCKTLKDFQEQKANGKGRLL